MTFDSMAYEQDLKFLARFKKLSESRKMPKDQVLKAKKAIFRVSSARKKLKETVKTSLSAVIEVSSRSKISGANNVTIIAKKLLESADKIVSDFKIAKMFSTPSSALKMSKAIAEGKKPTDNVFSVIKRISLGNVLENKVEQTNERLSWEDIEPAFNDSNKDRSQKIFNSLSDEIKKTNEVAQILSELRSQAKIISEYSKWRSTGTNTDTIAALVLFLEIVAEKSNVDELSFKTSDGMTNKVKMLKRDSKTLVRFLDTEAGVTELRDLLKTQTQVDKLEQIAKKDSTNN
jgi:hypothetical protein